ncbi:type I-E CRISPR-associated protein Cse2/CasB [Parasphaerochaeta coccoides]|uniref:CRISPR-associated protein, Cse2 family n=1 Tax=Parasphaerochaeta coccoides (strain ATCC BAA-1237 / DSM 17374 / SPN1) TaxID=760011 RepID=F4GL08_PARC1|nr:type I-E CRISPR-associated protein Cse2/CasB [Parasphaerochaeta coccoides]AEC02348.1 CRISPR-associated protein, Cse2 family [Parasphaerochaeta coccoides DSM 17374]
MGNDAFLSMISHAKTSKNKRLLAKLKKADHEETEFLCWDILVHWVDLEKTVQRRAYGLIAAGFAKSKDEGDGSLGLGDSLYQSFASTNKGGEPDTSSEAARLSRILSCSSALELIDVLRPIINLLISRSITLSFKQLLSDILSFDNEERRQKIRVHWAQQFYGKHKGKDNGEEQI